MANLMRLNVWADKGFLQVDLEAPFLEERKGVADRPGCDAET